MGLVALLLAPRAPARPIVYANSTTVMADYSEDAMREIQLFYAPRYNWSFGAGHLELGHGEDHRHEITYARLNLLAKRWNLDGAQANAFVWGGVGTAHVSEWVPSVTVPGAPPSEHDHGGGAPTTIPGYQRSLSGTDWNAGAQLDFETRRIYTSLKTDSHRSSVLEHRIDTLQFGIAPYEHDVDSLATWLVISGTRHSGDAHEGTEWALLLRFFKKRVWVEAGATTEGALRAHAMFSL
jgi:hypothetical protein